jgi:hypothetical protein
MSGDTGKKVSNLANVFAFYRLTPDREIYDQNKQ